MNIVYLLATYPSLTETFVAREINQVIKAGNRINICILRRSSPYLSSKAIRVENADEIRLTYNILKLIVGASRVFFTRPLSFIKVFFEL